MTDFPARGSLLAGVCMALDIGFNGDPNCTKNQYTVQRATMFLRRLGEAGYQVVSNG